LWAPHGIPIRKICGLIPTHPVHLPPVPFLPPTAHGRPAESAAVKGGGVAPLHQRTSPPTAAHQSAPPTAPLVDLPRTLSPRPRLLLIDPAQPRSPLIDPPHPRRPLIDLVLSPPPSPWKGQVEKHAGAGVPSPACGGFVTGGGGTRPSRGRLGLSHNVGWSGGGDASCYGGLDMAPCRGRGDAVGGGPPGCRTAICGSGTRLCRGVSGFCQGRRRNGGGCWGRRRDDSSCWGRRRGDSSCWGRRCGGDCCWEQRRGAGCCWERGRGAGCYLERSRDDGCCWERRRGGDCCWGHS
jgi:hypothetical protein